MRQALAFPGVKLSSKDFSFFKLSHLFDFCGHYFQVLSY